MKKNAILFGILLAMVVSAIAINQKKEVLQRDLAKEVFRFHVLANSDSKADQRLKMKVKEAILSYMKKELPSSDSVENTKQWAREHLNEIMDVAGGIIRQEGYDYPVVARVTSCRFPQKTYGDITFPSGEYEALRVEIGAAKGQNWWCVLYPNLCFIDAVHAYVPAEGKNQLKQVLEEDTYDMVVAKGKFKVRWFFF